MTGSYTEDEPNYQDGNQENTFLRDLEVMETIERGSIVTKFRSPSRTKLRYRFWGGVQ